MIIYENSKPKEKLKAWYLFTEDFVAGTQHLSNEEVGIYIRLLCFNWNKRCSGIPNDSSTQYRIANCFTDNEKKSCDNVLQEFFVLVNDKFQNERQLQEYLYISRRMEASKENGKLGGRPKKPSDNLDKTPLPHTPTSTSYPKKIKQPNYNPLFKVFWEKVTNKVSKGTAEKNYMKLEDKWIEKPEELADMYNKYYKSVEDKQFAKQPAFWLSAKKYEDEQPKAISTEKVDMYPFRLKQFKECVETETVKGYVVSTARHHTGDVQRAIAEGEFTKEQAEKYLDLRGWL
ncbi:MAG: YdaU family protein [Bacteroidota bacterium]|nr:YdaU family protein [Bacteroidota bacterium]